MHLQTNYEICYYPKKEKPTKRELYHESSSYDETMMVWNDISDFRFNYELYELEPKLVAKITR